MVVRNRIAVALEVIVIVISLSVCGMQIYAQQHQIEQLRAELRQSQQANQLTSYDQ